MSYRTKTATVVSNVGGTMEVVEVVSGAGAAFLADQTPTVNQVVTYDSTGQRWVAATESVAETETLTLSGAGAAAAFSAGSLAATSVRATRLGRTLNFTAQMSGGSGVDLASTGMDWNLAALAPAEAQSVSELTATFVGEEGGATRLLLLDIENQPIAATSVDFDATASATTVDSGVLSGALHFSPDPLPTGTPFVAVFTTSAPGETITLPADGVNGLYNCSIDWDGETTTLYNGSGGAPSHAFATAGDHPVTITGTWHGWRFNAGGDCAKLKQVTAWGDGFRLNTATTTQGGYFAGCTALESLPGSVVANVFVGTTSLASAFIDCAAFDGAGVDSWDVSAITSMASMFDGSAFDQDLSGWDVSAVTTMASFADGASWSEANYSATLIGWAALSPSLQSGVALHAGTATYTPAATAARGTLTGTHSWTITDGGSSTSPFQITINVASVPLTVSLPYQAAGDYDCTIDWGDGSAAEAYSGGGAASHEYTGSTGSKTISITGRWYGWNAGLWAQASLLTAVLAWGDDFRFNTATTLQGYQFYFCSALTSLPSSGPTSIMTDTTSMEGVFGACGALTSLDVDYMAPPGSVTNYANAFENCTNLATLSVAGWFSPADLSAVNISTAFTGCAALDFQLPAAFKPSRLDYAFRDCTAWNNGGGVVSGWDLSQCTTMGYAFNNAAAFAQDVSGWDTSAVTGMTSAFDGATLFDSDLGAWDIAALDGVSALSGFATSSGWSKANYSATLTGWALNVANIYAGMTLDAGTVEYTVAAAADRTTLLTKFAAINDGGQETPPAAAMTYTIATTGSNFVYHFPQCTTTGSRTMNYTISWGDGEPDSGPYTGGYAQNGAITHTYATAGTYTITVSGPFAWSARLSSGQYNAASMQALRTITSWGECIDLDSAFRGASGLTSVSTSEECPPISWTERFFEGCSALTTFSCGSSLIGAAIEAGKAHGSNMNLYRFLYGCPLDLRIGVLTNILTVWEAFSTSNWTNGGNATDLPQWTFASGSNRTFDGFVSFNPAFNQPIDGMDFTAAAASMNRLVGVFQDATSFNQPLPASLMAICGNVTWTLAMFQNCVAFNQPVNAMVIGQNVDVNVQNMFNGCTSFNQPIHGGNWNFDRLGVMTGFLDGCTSFSSANLDALFNAIAAGTPKSNVVFGASSTAPTSASDAARTTLTTTYNWTITTA